MKNDSSDDAVMFASFAAGSPRAVQREVVGQLLVSDSSSAGHFVSADPYLATHVVHYGGGRTSDPHDPEKR